MRIMIELGNKIKFCIDKNKDYKNKIKKYKMN